MYKFIKSIYFILITSLFCLPSYAFEINGFYSGMNGNEALNLLSKRTGNVKLVEGSSKHKSYFGTNNSGTEAITVCNELLTSYSSDYTSSFNAFIRLVEAENINTGKGSYYAESKETPAGRWDRLSFTWLASSNSKEISFSQIGSDLPQVTVRNYISGRCNGN